jgi:hypothetical protein
VLHDSEVVGFALGRRSGDNVGAPPAADSDHDADVQVPGCTCFNAIVVRTSKTKLPLLLAGLMFFGIWSCENHVSSHRPASRITDSFLAADAEGFAVKVMLGDKLKDELIRRRETIIVRGYITGITKNGTSKRYLNEVGEVDLRQIKAEITPGDDASFGIIELPQDLLAKTDGGDPKLLINVVSGRKSSRTNLLDCGIYQGNFKAIQSRSLAIPCRLIEE